MSNVGFLPTNIASVSSHTYSSLPALLSNRASIADSLPASPPSPLSMFGAIWCGVIHSGQARSSWQPLLVLSCQGEALLKWRFLQRSPHWNREMAEVVKREDSFTPVKHPGHNRGTLLWLRCWEALHSGAYSNSTDSPWPVNCQRQHVAQVQEDARTRGRVARLWFNVSCTLHVPLCPGSRLLLLYYCNVTVVRVESMSALHQSEYMPKLQGYDLHCMVMPLHCISCLLVVSASWHWFDNNEMNI